MMFSCELLFSKAKTNCWAPVNDMKFAGGTTKTTRKQDGVVVRIIRSKQLFRARNEYPPRCLKPAKGCVLGVFA